VELEGVLFSDDSRHFLSSLQALGFDVTIWEKEKRVCVMGCNGSIPQKEAEIDVGSAGTAARFLTAMLGFSDGVYTIQASEQMKKRPMRPLFELLERAGAVITYLEQEGCLPIRIEGCAYVKNGQKRTEQVRHDETALHLELDISKSTQFLSALLLISPMIKQGLHIHITSEKTDGSYIRITRGMLEEAGVEAAFDGRDYRVTAGASYKKKIYQIEPDVSAACYFYAAAAVTGGKALVRGVHSDNSQGDMRFLQVLEQMGCKVTEQPEGICVQGAKNGELHGITVDMNDFSDQALTLSAIAPYAKEAVRMEHIGHIRGQECDRLHAMATELTRLGICCEEEQDAITIYPGEPHGGVVQTYEDHRVAMAFSLIGLRTEGIIIDNPECCKKTFEEYFDMLEQLTTESEI
jgi:3-phosphoshikimate 1-carboxyvinyltransferase